MSEATGVVTPGPGKSDSLDQADRSCQVVLRSVERAMENGLPKTDCSSGECKFVWAGSVDVANSQIDAGATPALLFQTSNDPGNWFEVELTAQSEGASFVRYGFEFPGAPSGQSAETLLRTRIELVPFVRAASGERMFDHNRRPGEFENYVLIRDNDWAIGDDASICPSAG